MKICSDCKVEKSLSEFYIDRRDYRPSRRCKPCDKQRSRKWAKENPEGAAAILSRSNAKQRYARYGLTREQFESMVTGECGICWHEYKVPYIDHDHTTDKVREIICQQCNMALGLFMDNPEILRRAADYIERHRAKTEGDN